MTVGELRKALEGVPDEMEVLTYDEGYLSHEVSAEIVSCASGAKPKVDGDGSPPDGWRSEFRVIWEYSRHPEGTVGKRYFLIS